MNQNKKYTLILPQLPPVTKTRKNVFKKRAYISNIVTKTKGTINNQCIKNDVEPVKIFLILFNHKSVPPSPKRDIYMEKRA